MVIDELGPIENFEAWEVKEWMQDERENARMHGYKVSESNAMQAYKLILKELARIKNK